MRLVRAKELPAFFASGCAPCLMRFLGRVISSEANVLPVHCHSSAEPSSSPFHPARKVAGCEDSVPKVFAALRQPQITPAIISRVTVPVINFRRLGACLHFPNDAMGKISDMFYCDKNPTCRIYVAGILARIPSIPRRACSRVRELMQWSFLPCEDAGLRTVTETIAQIARVRQWFRHSFVSLKTGALA